MKFWIFALFSSALMLNALPAHADIYAPSDEEVRKAQKDIEFTLSDSDLCAGVATQNYTIDGVSVQQGTVSKLLFPGGKTGHGEIYYRQLGSDSHYLAKYTHLVTCHIVPIKEEPNYIFILNEQVQLIKPQRYLNLVELFENMGLGVEAAKDVASDVLAELDQDKVADEPCVDDWRYCLNHHDVFVGHPEAINACVKQMTGGDDYSKSLLPKYKGHKWFTDPRGSFDRNTGVVTFFDKAITGGKQIVKKCEYSLVTRDVLKIQ